MTSLHQIYDVIVVGAGHAGCEAAAAAAAMGASTLLLTMDMHKIAQMSCNPAVGGIAKGQIVREIDALGGQMGLITDKTMIQFRMLNQSKGPAMWSPRAQSDRMRFAEEWRNVLESFPNLDIWQGKVVSLLFDGDSVCGVSTDLGIDFESKSVILTNGTFLNGLIHIGKQQSVGGRISEPNSVGLSEQLLSRGFRVGRMKTGTPVRIDGRSIDFSVLERQDGDTKPGKFSFLAESKSLLPQKPCFIARTNTEVHDTLKAGFHFSPLFDGTIKSIGPRYCPSIEDKLRTFAEKDSHQLFLEPEGVDIAEYYLNGFSSSLPWDIQYSALRKIPGFEKVKIFRPGYAIEYDYFDPTQLHHTLETKAIANLFFAGQINGTTGYEEAGAQGLIAGINATLKVQCKPEFVLARDEAYIGVLIDDLVSKGVTEPYRMFTSRAEFRILLRQDNADSRLTIKGYEIGLASQHRLDMFLLKQQIVNSSVEVLRNTSVSPTEIDSVLINLGSSPLSQRTKLDKVLLRPQVHIVDILQFLPQISSLLISDIPASEILEQIELTVKYEGYVQRERELADKIKRLEHLKIPENFDFDRLQSLSIEARQKLNKAKPATIADASRISGVNPSDVNVLLVAFKR
jgi:tRNA uridine 5-carboxymethylaminomethyl modification enzyme